MSHHDRRFSFDKAHKLDDEARKRRQPAEALVEALELRGDETVIDLGAGTGYFGLPIASRLQALGGRGKLLALDVEPRMLELVKTRAAAAGLSERIALGALDDSGPALPLGDASAERALLANLYHELPDPRATLGEIARVLAPGGQVLIVDWDPAGTTEIGPPLEHRVPRREVERALAESGFGDVEGLPLYRDFYAIRARRS